MAGKRILVVEDDPAISIVLEELLADEGASVVGNAARVAEALQALAAESYDLVIVDLNLGGEMSWPVIAEARKRGIPFIVMSGSGDLTDAPLAGATVLAKPFSLSGFLQAVEQIMGNRQL